MEIVLAQPRGFCAGVTRAIEIVERALELHGTPVYVYHEIVHNGHVVDDLRRRGAVFVDDIDAIPPGAVTVFSAHGVANGIVRQARDRGLRVIDATCPLVAKVHLQARKYARGGRAIAIIGHAGHEEVVGTMGAVDDATVHLVSTLADVASLPTGAAAPAAYVTQTTLSPDDTREIIAALTARYPGIVGPELEDICYATHNRQNAVRRLAEEVDLVLVVGAPNSSNTTRLREVALQSGVPAHQIQGPADIDERWLAGVRRVGITAGASTPELLVQGVRERLAALGADSVRTLPGPRERLRFRLPPLLASEPA
jgi:4-hydroxy-3-methylbut-2-enyl diphosphate reductase